MTAASSSQLPENSWEQPNLPSISRRKVPAQAVPDDWDNDDDDDDDGPVTAEDNQRIWDNANTKAPNPMPTLIIAPSATSSSHVVPPPQGAFQHTMRILKRPNSGADSKSRTPTPSSGETLREREARYQAARQRIFGPNSGSSTPSMEEPSNPNSTPPLNLVDKHDWTTMPPPPATVIRNPRGPPIGSGESDNTAMIAPMGFGGQRANKSSVRPSQQTEAEGL